MQQLVQQPAQQDVVLLLDPSAVDGDGAVTNAMTQQQQLLPPDLQPQVEAKDMLQLCYHLAAEHGVKLTVLEHSQLLSSSPSPASASSMTGSVASSITSSSGLSALVPSGLANLARRTAGAAASVLKAVQEAAAAARLSDEQEGVDTTPDLPDMQLRLRWVESQSS